MRKWAIQCYYKERLKHFNQSLNNSLFMCGNKMLTRCNRWFLLQILLLAQHVSGTIMPIIRSSRVLYKWLLAGKPDTQPSAPHHTDNLKTKHQIRQASNHLYNTLEFLMMGIIVPETCWASSKICNNVIHVIMYFKTFLKLIFWATNSFVCVFQW